MIALRHTTPGERFRRWLLLAVLVLAAAVIFAAIGFRFLPRDVAGEQVLEALRTRRPALARMLIRLGADPTYGTGSASPVHLAAAAGDVEMLRFLLEHGVDVDRPIKWGITPLHKAREHHQREAEQFLLAHGADPNRVPQPQP